MAGAGNVAHVRLSTAEVAAALEGRAFKRLAGVDLGGMDLRTVFVDPPRQAARALLRSRFCVPMEGSSLGASLPRNRAMLFLPDLDQIWTDIGNNKTATKFDQPRQTSLDFGQLGPGLTKVGQICC